MIDVTVTAVPDSCHGPKGTLFRASCVVDGIELVAESRTGATNALARQLAANGFPDDEMRVTASFTIPSYFGHAKRTYSEGENQALRIVGWRPYLIADSDGADAPPDSLQAVSATHLA